MLLFYIAKIKKGLKEFKIKTKFAPLTEEEKEKNLCEFFDILFSDNLQKETAIDNISSEDKIKIKK